jgi:PleD family two-component response regulator
MARVDVRRRAWIKPVMTQKNMRILIADEHHDQLLTIEKRLNGLGYYRIAPVRSFDELDTLTDSADDGFDLLIANTALGTPYGVDMAEFCRARPHIRHALFYQSPASSLGLVLDCPDKRIQAFLAESPTAASLRALMTLLDPPLQRTPPKVCEALVL